MYVVIQKNYYGYEEGGYSVSAIFGPFATVEEANELAKLGNSKNLYAEDFEVEQLEADLPDYIKNWGK